MDLSALIFVALAGAWAVYLVPKALTAHEVEDETRSVEDFSDRMRVLARREAREAGDAELVVTGPTPRVEESPVAEEPSPSAGQSSAVEAAAVAPGARHATPARAARRRRRVLGLVLLGLVGTGVVAGLGIIGWPWLAVPSTLLVAWLVACRVAVKNERVSRRSQQARTERHTPAEGALADADGARDGGPGTEEIPVVAPDAPAAAEGGWDPVPITLPTYVEKAPAGRTVRTIDLDSTGVWSSGRNEADSHLAREAERAQQVQRDVSAEDHRRASGD